MSETTYGCPSCGERAISTAHACAVTPDRYLTFPHAGRPSDAETVGAEGVPLFVAPPAVADHAALLHAAERPDWMQAARNGTPCFYVGELNALDDGDFCLRADYWPGHLDPNPSHRFVSFHAMLAAALRHADARVEAAYERGVGDVLRIRCMTHRDVPQMNDADSKGGECGACIHSAIIDAAQDIGCAEALLYRVAGNAASRAAE